MRDLYIMFDFGLEEPPRPVSWVAMVLELATVLLGVCVGAVAVLYAAPKGYLGHPRKKGMMTSLESYAPKTEQAEVQTPAVPAWVAPAPSTAPPLYESVQPAPAPVTYASPSSTSFGAPSMSKKPIRTYRRRTAPVRSTSVSKTTRTKPKKR